MLKIKTTTTTCLFVFFVFFVCFVCSFVRSFVRSFVHLFVRSFVLSFVRSFIRFFLSFLVFLSFFLFFLGIWGDRERSYERIRFCYIMSINITDIGRRNRYSPEICLRNTLFCVSLQTYTVSFRMETIYMRDAEKAHPPVAPALACVRCLEMLFLRLVNRYCYKNDVLGGLN